MERARGFEVLRAGTGRHGCCGPQHSPKRSKDPRVLPWSCSKPT